MKNSIKHYLILFLFLLSNAVGASPVDSLNAILEVSKTAKDYDTTIKVYMELGDHYYEQTEYNKAIESYSKAITFLKNGLDNKSLDYAYFQRGRSYEKIDDNYKALQDYYALTELENSQTSGDLRAKSFNRIGIIYKNLGNFDKAFDAQLTALKINEQEKDSVGVSRIYYSIGSLFYYQGQNEEALKYYKKSKEICDKLQKKNSIYACLEAIASVYSQTKMYKESVEYSTQAMELAKKIDYKTGIAYSKGNLAIDLRRRKKFHESEKLFLESLKIKEGLNDTWGVIGGQLTFSDLYLAWNKPKKAIQILKEAERLSEEIKSKTRRTEIYERLKNVYVHINEHEKALLYFDKYVALKDSVFNDKMAEEMGQTKNKYEIEQKENEITLLKKENELFETNKELQKLQKYIFLIITIFFMVFCYVIYSRLKFQRTTNVLLEEKNKEIQIQNIELKQTQDKLLESNILLEEKNILLADKNEEIHTKNKLLESSNEDLAQFAYVASHDLKEPLRMIGSYTTLLKRRYNDLYDEAGKEFMHYIVDAVGRMENMLTDLLSYSRVGTQTDTRDWVDTEDIMVIVEANLRARLQENNAKLVFNAKNLPAVKANRTHMTQLLQNLVSNAVKFKGERDPIVEIGCKYDNEIFTFSVKDNGIGISEDNLKKVFEMFRRLHTRDEYEGTGIGLATCKKIVAKHGGDIWVESVYGEGSTFFFTIPSPVSELKKVEVSV